MPLTIEQRAVDPNTCAHEKTTRHSIHRTRYLCNSCGAYLYVLNGPTRLNRRTKQHGKEVLICDIHGCSFVARHPTYAIGRRGYCDDHEHLGLAAKTAG